MLGRAVVHRSGLFAAARRHAADSSVIVLTIAVLSGGIGSVRATTLTSPIPLTHPEQVASARFGCSVATDGTQFLVGACFDDTGAQDAGSAFVFDASGVRLRTLRAASPTAGMQFGFASAIAGVDPVVATPHQNHGGFAHAGVTLVFDGATGSPCYDPTPQAGGYFGAAIAAAGNDLVIGAPNSDSFAGAAYHFSHAGMLLHVLTNPDPTRLTTTNRDRFDGFGKAVAADSLRAVVGAPYEPTDKKNAGAVYVYDLTTGALVTTLRSPHPAANDHFGAAVAISGAYILVGAPDDDFDTQNGGMAYLFDAQVGGPPVLSLSNPRHTADAAFGTSVGFLNGAVVVGAPREDVGAADAGSVYVFDPTGVQPVVKVDHPTPLIGDRFGEVLAAKGTALIIASPAHASNGGPSSGVAYLYRDTGAPITTTTTILGTTSTTTSTTTTTTTSDESTTTTEESTTTSLEESTTTTTDSPPSTNEIESTTTTAVTTTSIAGSTTTTVPAPCLSDDECTHADCAQPRSCIDGTCVAGAATGLEGVVCNLQEIHGLLAGATPTELGGRRRARKLLKAQARAAVQVAQAAHHSGRARVRRLRRAERRVARLAHLVHRLEQRGVLRAPLSTRLLTLATSTGQQLASLRHAST